MYLPLRSFLSMLAATLVACSAGLAELPRTSSSTPESSRSIDGTDRPSIDKEVAAADDYLIGHGVAQNVHLAAESYERAANLGDAGAQNQIGYLYQTGIGVPQNMERAVHWYQLSAANGSINGKVNLAVAYIWGLGVKQDQQLGESLLREASEKGSGIAAAYLGDMYVGGIGVTADPVKAMTAYERGVKLHSYYAEYRLGLALSKPYQHPQNLERSVALLRKSVSEGYVPAMYLLGLIAVNHRESNVPQQEALELLRRASDAGSWRSSTILGVLAREGKWVPQNKEEAYQFFKRAALQGKEAAAPVVRNDLLALAHVLDPGTIEKLDIQVMEWESKHPVCLQVIYKKGQKLVPLGAYALSSPGPGQHVGMLVSPVAD